MFVLKILMDFKEFPTFEIKESENFGKLRVLGPELSAPGVECWVPHFFNTRFNNNVHGGFPQLRSEFQS